eukprot:scaffold1365_cov163-Ochromonas_danica.AAC.4
MTTRKIWISSKTNGWELGDFLEETDGDITVRLGNGERKKVSKADTFRSDPSHFQVLDDLCNMTFLHEAPLLDSLRRRFGEDVIYTTAGNVLISVNPYKDIPGLYANPLLYLDLPSDGDVAEGGSKPHVFNIANFALLQMLYGQKLTMDEDTPVNQSIVVSGESGAGKTESSKQVMNFLIAADMEMSRGGQESNRLGDSIRRVLVRSNIIFEAFGNAKTVRNDNSSRFGKYIKLQYSNDNNIVSAFTETFLLEKSRLMAVGANERNYHVFYLLIHSAGVALREKFHLHSPEQFRMLVDSEGKVAHAPQDDLFSELLDALITMGCTEEELESLWSVLGAMLHLGNLLCEEKTDGERVVPDGDIANHLPESHVHIVSPTIVLEELTNLLGISSELFRSRLTTQRVKVSTRRSVTIKFLNTIDVSNNIAALIKWMYSCIFAWLVSKVNFAFCNVSATAEYATRFIGILDIFGFEILQQNSFEQLCINYTNERLQQQFNEYVFDREQEIYRNEGLDWRTIDYHDNQHVIDLIGKKPLGLLPILEAQGMLNRGSADEAALLTAFNQSHDKRSAAYEKSRFGSDLKFTIKHFAGDVTYTVTGFLEKNNDSLQEDLMDLMICTSNAFIRNAVVAVGMGDGGTAGEPGFVDKIDPTKIVASSAGNLSMAASRPESARDATKKMAATGRRASLVAVDGGGKKLASLVTVSFQFRSQLDILMNTLRSTSPHYIKCIKPNASKMANIFDGSLVLEQLRYSGALEVVRIRQEG